MVLVGCKSFCLYCVIKGNVERNAALKEPFRLQMLDCCAVSRSMSPSSLCLSRSVLLQHILYTNIFISPETWTFWGAEFVGNNCKFRILFFSFSKGLLCVSYCWVVPIAPVCAFTNKVKMYIATGYTHLFKPQSNVPQQAYHSTFHYYFSE